MYIEKTAAKIIIEIEKTHEVKLNKHVQELARLREKSLAEKSYSAAVNAERLRGQAAGLYIDRKEIRTGSIDSMSRDDVLKALKDLGIDGEFKKEGNNTNPHKQYLFYVYDADYTNEAVNSNSNNTNKICQIMLLDC